MGIGIRIRGKNVRLEEIEKQIKKLENEYKKINHLIYEKTKDGTMTESAQKHNIKFHTIRNIRMRKYIGIDSMVYTTSHLKELSEKLQIDLPEDQEKKILKNLRSVLFGVNKIKAGLYEKHKGASINQHIWSCISKGEKLNEISNNAFISSCKKIIYKMKAYRNKIKNI